MPDVYVEKADNLYFNSSKDQSFKVSTVNKFKNDLGAFTPIGVVKSITTRKDYMDPFDMVIALSGKEQKLFQEIKDYSDRNLRIASMNHWDDLDKSVKGILYQRLVNIKKVGLIRKIYAMSIPEDMQDKALTARVVNLLTHPGKFTFILNPDVVKGFEINSARLIWDQLKDK